MRYDICYGFGVHLMHINDVKTLKGHMQSFQVEFSNESWNATTQECFL